MLASIIYNYGKFCDDFKSTLKLGAYATKAGISRVNIRPDFLGALDIPAYFCY
jgi:hypothetical protein